MADQKRFHIITYGCQMNIRDSEAMAGLLAQMGYAATDDPEQADVILMNTCTVREGAEERAYGRIGELKALKKRRPGLLLGMAGCIPQKDGEEVLRRAPYLDLVLGVHNLHRLPALITQAIDGCMPVYEVWKRSPRDRDLPRLPAVRTHRVKAFVNIIHGCNKWCTFCIVPIVRGLERSVPPAHVLAEVQELAAQGYREITLLGQNVDSYGHDLRPRMDLADLLRLVHDVPGIERLRFTTSHPKDMTPRLIEAVAKLPKACEHIHLPVQAGDDEVLRRMRRGYTAARYKEIVAAIRERLPGCSITTDVIVGFPGETEEQFEATLRLVEEVRFDACNTAMYSPREGTRAADYEDQVDEETKKRRLWALNKLAERVAFHINQSLVGTAQEVLVEERGERGTLVGRTRTHKIVTFDGLDDLIGQAVPVRIASAGSWVLRGTLQCAPVPAVV
ncbi:MAG: tRNA (N6-isopentenyl adenosine(37)-C2)-methylthiotransferase MiaB [Armatimonadetes bacterium]|nr:tRNA (N6-isopentenyl adenosine(37)-C2)-methylthiotransferase MiaB [Armatimonadota bacterium]